MACPSDRERRFLLQSAVLDRLYCDRFEAVTEQRDCAEMREGLERANVFIVALDDRCQWYRYYPHLFAELLQQRLLVELPGEVPALHCGASGWS